jgi:hypothetical protein
MPTSGHLEDYIDGLVEEAAPDAANDMLLIRDDTTGLMKKISPVTIAAAGGTPLDGWISAAAMTYASADDPSYTLTLAGDVSTTYGLGMRIKLTQATGGTKYFIITKIAVAGATTLTLYGGTDYNLENEAISSPYYSLVKAPFGFPLDPTKWTIEITDVTARTQATPNAATWYNINAAGQISIPIGIWYVSYKVASRVYDSDGNSMRVKVTLSTANNSESDVDFTSVMQVYHGNDTEVTHTFCRQKTLGVTSKTLYYLNSCSTIAGMDYIKWDSDNSKMILSAICAYL